MRKAYWRWLNISSWLAVASLVALLQACDSGSNNNFSSNGNSGNVSTNRTVAFNGSILFVKDGNLFILHGKDESVTPLTSNGSAFQPSVSPDGSTIAFELRKPGSDYSDLATMPLAGGSVKLHTDDRLLCRCDPDKSGVYHYQFWAGNPIWTADGKNLIYLSDFYKGGRQQNLVNQTCIGNAIKDSIQDLGIVEMPANAKALPAIPAFGNPNKPRLLAWPYCYAGGDQDLSLRPGVSDTEILFTSFRYIPPQNIDLGAQISLLIIPKNGGAERVIQLSPADPKVIPLEPSFSPDGKYITYIRRENGQDDLYIMPVDATITGTPNDEVYGLEGNGRSTYYTNTTYYGQSQQLASGIIGNPVWGSNNTLFFMMFANGEFNLYMAKVKFTNPTPTATPKATPGTTPTASAPAGPIITLDGDPMLLTQGGVDGTTAPIWYH